MFGQSDRRASKPTDTPMKYLAERDPDGATEYSSTTGDPMPAPGRRGSFNGFERRLRGHSGLKKAGPTLVDAFVTLARGVWEDTQEQTVPREAGNREKFIPFSPCGTKQNLADAKFRRGAIEFALKLPEGELHRLDPEKRTKPLKESAGRWASYHGGRRFTLQNPEDVSFLKALILACVPKLAKHGKSSPWPSGQSRQTVRGRPDR